MIEQFLATQVGLAVKGVLVMAFANWLFGTIAALQAGTFSLDVWMAFLRKHVLGRVAPIFGLLLVGYLGNEPLLTGAGILAATGYVAETVGNLLAKFAPNLLPSLVKAPPPPQLKPQD